MLQDDLSRGGLLDPIFRFDRKLVMDSPDVPSPLALLYGSCKNPLANKLHQRMRALRSCDNERLAGGWLAYLTIKWALDPSQSRFERLPDFMRPVTEQLCYPHHSDHDYVLWPQLRANLILKQGQYDPEKVHGLFACCLKVRWPWGKNILEPKADGELGITMDFYQTFTSLNGWGVTSDFTNKYPELLEGMDINSVCYEPR